MTDTSLPRFAANRWSETCDTPLYIAGTVPQATEIRSLQYRGFTNSSFGLFMVIPKVYWTDNSSSFV